MQNKILQKRVLQALYLAIGFGAVAVVFGMIDVVTHSVSHEDIFITLAAITLAPASFALGIKYAISTLKNQQEHKEEQQTKEIPTG